MSIETPCYFYARDGLLTHQALGRATSDHSSLTIRSRYHAAARDPVHIVWTEVPLVLGGWARSAGEMFLLHEKLTAEERAKIKDGTLRHCLRPKELLKTPSRYADSVFVSAAPLRRG